MRVNQLRVLQRGHVAYDQSFHDGVNIIRGQNGSGKSTIADFVFFVLGGEFDDWKEAAGRCSEVQAEIETPRGKLTLRRAIETKTSPIDVFFGSMTDAADHALEGWERFPIRRQGGRESFSQVMFRSLRIPEAQSEGASNITMHQLMRLCYSDQRTPSARLFRFEQFDTQNIREAVGDLICGISGYEIYEIELTLRDLQKELDELKTRLSGLLKALPTDEAFRTPALVNTAVHNLKTEKEQLQKEIDSVDEAVEVGEVKEYLTERRAEQRKIMRQRERINASEHSINNVELELREIEDFLVFLNDMTEKLALTEIAFETIGSIEFSHCPSCGAELDSEAASGHCVVCRNPTDPEQEQSRYNQIRLDLEIQSRESNQLISQKGVALEQLRQDIRRQRRVHEREMTEFEIKFSGSNGPREAFLAERTNRLGHIDAEIDYLIGTLEIAEEIEALNETKLALQGEIETLSDRNKTLRDQAFKRRSVALNRVSEIGASLLHADDNRQDEFENASTVGINFVNDAILVDDKVNFADSSNVFLKNAGVLSVFLAAASDDDFYHPSFVLFDNIEDKGMEEVRSHLFQRLIVERATEIESPYQVIFTTSMMNPELELDDYVIGPKYTSQARTLDLLD